MSDVIRGPWVTRYEPRLIEVIGRESPFVLVEKWQENNLGERRFVELVTYVPQSEDGHPKVAPGSVDPVG